MKKYLKIYNSIFTILFIILISGVILSSFFDLKINIAITNFNSAFGMICASFGQLPCWCMMSFFGIMAFRISHLIKRKIYKILLIIFSFFIIGVSTYLIFNDMNSQYNGFYKISNFYIRIVLAFLFEIIMCFIGYKLINTDDLSVLLRLWIILMITFFIGLLIVFIMKRIWARPRYRLIYNGCNSYTVFELFKPWYKVGPGLTESLYLDEINSDDFRSFPSGHSYDSMASILISYIPFLNRNQKDKPWISCLILGITSCYALIIGFSRILYGAHFLSDVCFGGLICISCAFIIPYIGFKISLRKENVKNC